MSSVATFEEDVAALISGLDACRNKNREQQLAVSQLTSKIERVQMGTKRRTRRNLMAQFEEAQLRELKELKSKKAAALEGIEKAKEAAEGQKKAVEEVLRGEREQVEVPETPEDQSDETREELRRKRMEVGRFKQMIQLQKVELARRREQLAGSQRLPESRRDALLVNHQKAMREKSEKVNRLEGKIRRVQTAHLEEERQWNEWMVEGVGRKIALREQLDALQSRLL